MSESEGDDDQPDKDRFAFDQGFFQLVVGTKHLVVLDLAFEVEGDIQDGELPGVFDIQ